MSTSQSKQILEERQYLEGVYGLVEASHFFVCLGFCFFMCVSLHPEGMGSPIGSTGEVSSSFWSGEPGKGLRAVRAFREWGGNPRKERMRDAGPHSLCEHLPRPGLSLGSRMSRTNLSQYGLRAKAPPNTGLTVCSWRKTQLIACWNANINTLKECYTLEKDAHPMVVSSTVLQMSVSSSFVNHVV